MYIFITVKNCKCMNKKSKLYLYYDAQCIFKPRK